MFGRLTKALLCAVMFAGLLFGTVRTSAAEDGADGLWRDIDANSIQLKARTAPLPSHYRTLALDAWMLGNVLAAAPMETLPAATKQGVTLVLPLPDGGFERFRVWESPILEPELASKHPEIRTYAFQGIDDPAASGRMTLTPAGLNVTIRYPAGTIWIEPALPGKADHYISYHGRNGPVVPIKCDVHSADLKVDELVHEMMHKDVFTSVSTGDELRIYRTAIATTGEYTALAGGVAGALARITTTISALNAIFEVELSVRLTLVANNTVIIFTDPATDGYTDGTPGSMLNENLPITNTAIGEANFDFGHVFGGSGGGGVAGVGPCRAGFKPWGASSSGSPTGSGWVSLVAHEMGHQMSMGHSFNGTVEQCGPNRSANDAVEPGSGTTIMSYQGICGSDNIGSASASNAYYHARSLFSGASYTHVAPNTGTTCGTTQATGNLAPTPVNAGNDRTIPKSTPFELCGSAADPNGDPLTYTWEQIDTGPASAPNAPSGNAPLFRSFPPKTSPCRSFPQVGDILSNTATLGEILPGYAREMDFRLTARDNKAGGGGVASDDVMVNVDGVSGPFQVTSQSTATTWAGGSTQTITWNVAGTTAAPVSCANVDIQLSADGGQTFPTTLLAATANDGSQAITAPSIGTLQGRVKVKCSDNIFFDISKSDIRITPVVGFRASSGSTDSCPTNAGNNNGTWEPGETLALQATVRSTVALTGLTGTLTSSTTGITVVDGSASFANVGAGADVTTTAPHFIVRAGPSVACGSEVVFTLTVTSNESLPSQTTFRRVIGGYSAPAGLPITTADGGTITSTLKVDEFGPLTDLDVNFNPSHQIDELTVKLTSPAGIEVTLMDRPGIPTPGACTNFIAETTFDDEAATSAATLEACGAGNLFDGSSVGSSSLLSAFDDQPTAGTWTLSVSDAAGTFVGDLEGWRLLPTPALPSRVCTVCPTDPTLTVIKAGSGAGSVSSAPAGINCGGDCNEAKFTQRPEM